MKKNQLQRIKIREIVISNYLLLIVGSYFCNA